MVVETCSHCQTWLSNEAFRQQWCWLVYESTNSRRAITFRQLVLLNVVNTSTNKLSPHLVYHFLWSDNATQQRLLLCTSLNYNTASLGSCLSCLPCEWQTCAWFPLSVFCFRSSHISLNTSNPVATLPDAWHHRVSTETGWSSVSILWLGENVWSATCASHLYPQMKFSLEIKIY